MAHRAEIPDKMPTCVAASGLLWSLAIVASPKMWGRFAAELGAGTLFPSRPLVHQGLVHEHLELLA